MFSLLETLRWSPTEGYYLVDRHLKRLLKTAAELKFRIDAEAVVRELELAALSFSDSTMRVRLVVQRDGEVQVDSVALAQMGSIQGSMAFRVCFAREPIDPKNTMLYYKTTSRELYEHAFATRGNTDDVILWNMEGFVTESTRANIVVRLEGEFVTPPVSCGLLPGTLRELLLEKKEIVEGMVRKEQLNENSELYLMNSVRGMWKAGLVETGS